MTMTFAGMVMSMLGPLVHTSVYIIGRGLMIVGIVASIIITLLGRFHADTDKDQEIKNMPRTRYQAKAVSKRYVGVGNFTEKNGNAVHGDAFEVTFEYVTHHTKHIVKTYGPVNDKDAAVCMWLAGKDMLVDIDVFGDYCVIKSDLSPYYEEEIYLIDEDDVKDTGNYNSAGLQTMVFFNKTKFRHNFMLGILVVFFSIFPLVMLIRDGFNLIHIMFIIVLLYVCYVFFKNSISYYYKWQTALKGVDQETSEFRCYEGSSDEDGVTDYCIDYTFVNRNGIKMSTTDKVNEYIIYNRVQNMKTIPIKVYGNNAVLNIDRIQN